MNRFFKPACILVFAALLTQPLANAGVSFSTVTRAAMMQAVITAAGGTGGKIKLLSGCTIPSGVAAATGCTLLATGVWASGPIGTASNGTITWDGAGMTQTNSAHVAGTPTFAHITTSADVVVARIDMCTGSNAPCWTFTGATAAGQNINLSGLTLTAGSQ